jgi:hypothetical protein
LCVRSVSNHNAFLLLHPRNLLQSNPQAQFLIGRRDMLLSSGEKTEVISVLLPRVRTTLKVQKECAIQKYFSTISSLLGRTWLGCRHCTEIPLLQEAMMLEYQLLFSRKGGAKSRNYRREPWTDL